MPTKPDDPVKNILFKLITYNDLSKLIYYTI